ncbi:MAG: TetR/AcrR family transcriptional regulator, partial [Oscillospiraceae bacterium]|nr:TetR/AcrR family transcriptional regulator [Oscillospiraceae bacterium]
MGRTRYTDEERGRIMTTFIRAAREIIDAEGIDNISIRKIASLTGMNSATMYLYFPDSDVLTTMALMGYLEKYCRALAADMPQMKTPEDALFHSWEVFCRYAFANPCAFQHIFFCRHTFPLAEIIDRYYQLFPDQLKNI